MTTDLKFWLAKQLVDIGLFFGALALCALVAFILAWRADRIERKQRATLTRTDR